MADKRKETGHYNTYGTIAMRLDSFPYHRTRKEIQEIHQSSLVLLAKTYGGRREI